MSAVIWMGQHIIRSAIFDVAELCRQAAQNSTARLFTDDTVRGILSEKDYVLHLNHGAFCPSSIVAAHVMTPKVVSGTNDTPILEYVSAVLSCQ